MYHVNISVFLLVIFNSINFGLSAKKLKQFSSTIDRSKDEKWNNIRIFYEVRRAEFHIPQVVAFDTKMEQRDSRVSNNFNFIPEFTLRHPAIFDSKSIRVKHSVPRRMPGHVIKVDANQPVYNGQCSSEDMLKSLEKLRNNACAPRPIIVKLVSTQGEVSPQEVLTEECTGYCNARGGKSACLPIETKMENVSVRIVKKDYEILCTNVSIPKDIKCTCGCDKYKQKHCLKGQRFDEDFCECKCKHIKKKDRCQQKIARMRQHKWDENSCSCVCLKKETPCTTGTIWNRNQCKCVKKK